MSGSPQGVRGARCAPLCAESVVAIVAATTPQHSPTQAPHRGCSLAPVAGGDEGAQAERSAEAGDGGREALELLAIAAGRRRDAEPVVAIARRDPQAAAVHLVEELRVLQPE